MANDLFIVSIDLANPDAANCVAWCSCGASARKSEVKRFLSRHPRICSERRRFAQQLAQGTRCVEGTDHSKRRGLV